MSIQLEIRRYRGGDRHFHDYSQILFPLQGSMKLDIEGRSDVVSSHCMAIIPQSCEHDFEPSGDCSMLIMDVATAALAGERLPDVLRDQKPVVTRIDPWLWRLFRQLGAEVEADARRGTDAASLVMTGLQLVRPLAALPPLPFSERRILDVARTLGEGAEAATVKDMARLAGLGQSQFHALFRAATGQSPKQYHLCKLLDRAVDRLIGTSDPVSQIAYSLGYENVSSFNRLFKRRFGVTPSEFRAADRRH